MTDTVTPLDTEVTPNNTTVVPVVEATAATVEASDTGVIGYIVTAKDDVIAELDKVETIAVTTYDDAEDGKYDWANIALLLAAFFIVAAILVIFI